MIFEELPDPTNEHNNLTHNININKTHKSPKIHRLNSSYKSDRRKIKYKFMKIILQITKKLRPLSNITLLEYESLDGANEIPYSDISKSSAPPWIPKNVMLFFKFSKAAPILTHDFKSSIHNETYFRDIDSRLHHGWVQFRFNLPKNIPASQYGKLYSRIDSNDDFNAFNDIRPSYPVVMEHTRGKLNALFSDRDHQYRLEPLKVSNERGAKFYKTRYHLLKQAPRLKHNHIDRKYRDYIENFQNVSAKRRKLSITGPYVIEAIIYLTKNYFATPLMYLPYIAAQTNNIFKHPSIKANIAFRLKEIRDYPNKITADNLLQTLEDFAEYKGTHSPTIDVAILISTKIRQLKTLNGHAYRNAICTPNLSCLIAQDEGFDTAHIIGHEIGHLFGCIHDMDNECYREDKRGIMHYYSTGGSSHTWSTCCSSVIAKILRTDRVKCLLKIGNFKDTITSGHLPGKYLSHEQCHINFDPSSIMEFTNSSCGELWCLNATYLYSLKTPPFDGTSCTINGIGQTNLSPYITGFICLHGKCIEERKVSLHNKGQWGYWGPWNKCLGFCPTGYRYRHRDCILDEDTIDTEYCLGDSQDIELCNNRQCSSSHSNSYLLNQEVCSRFMPDSTFDQTSDFPCLIGCNDGNNIWVQVAQVYDGTSYNSSALCVDGNIIT